MSTEKNVFNSLFANNKVELASQQIQLALMDDIKAAIGKYKSLDDTAKNFKNKAVDSLISYYDNIRVAYQNATNAISMINDLDKKSKELGLPDSGLGGYKKELSGKANEYKSMLSKVDSIAKSL